MLLPSGYSKDACLCAYRAGDRRTSWCVSSSSRPPGCPNSKVSLKESGCLPKTRQDTDIVGWQVLDPGLLC